jgi:Flp pilus assembly protein TadB
MRKTRKQRDQSTANPVVHSITNAQEGLTIDQSTRQRRYFISMMVRTACFILTVLLPSPYRWFALAGATFLPYIAVIFANAGRETIKSPTVFFNASGKELQ